jgi:hypothetical protein
MAEKKYRLKQPDVDLAADARHRHIPGTSYHWKHGYIPLDARTATLFGKKAAAKRLIEAGKVSIHEPEGVKTINSRGLSATRPLSIVPVEKRKPESAAPAAPQAPKVDISLAEPITVRQHEYLKALKEFNAANPNATFQNQRYALPDTGSTIQSLHVRGHIALSHDVKWSREAQDNGTWTRPTYVLTPKGQASLAKAEALKEKRSLKPPKAKVERDPYDMLLSPKSGDVLNAASTPGYEYRYRFSGSQWIKEYRRETPLIPGGPEPAFRRLSTKSPADLRATARHRDGEIGGIESSQIQAELDKRHEALAAESLAAAHKLFGKEKVHGFTAIDGRTAAIQATYGMNGDLSAGKGLLRDYVPEPGMVHLIHDNGTQVRIDGVTAKKMNTEIAHRLAGVTTDVVENYVHDAKGMGAHNPLTFHVDAKYSSGRNWATKRSETLAYVRHGDTQNVHMSPNSAMRDTNPLTEAQRAATKEHFTAGHVDFPTQAHGTLIHEIGHVIDNRQAHTGIGGRNHDALDFHHEVLPSGGLGLVPGARYARSNPHEGFAEAFTHAVATRHATELARNKRRVEDEETKKRRAAHDAMTAKYDAKYGFFREGGTP